LDASASASDRLERLCNDLSCVKCNVELRLVSLHRQKLLVLIGEEMTNKWTLHSG